MYEMLTGQRPFDKGATPQATVLLRKEVPPRPLRELLPQIDGSWELAIGRCLEPEPADRFPHARDICATLASGPPSRKSPARRA